MQKRINFKRVLSLLLAVITLLGCIGGLTTANAADSATLTRGGGIEYPLAWSELSWGARYMTATYQGTSFPVYCLEPKKDTPVNDTYTAEELDNNSALRKCLYYCYGGPGQSEYLDTIDWSGIYTSGHVPILGSSENDIKYVISHLAASYYYNPDGWSYGVNATGRQAAMAFISFVDGAEWPADASLSFSNSSLAASYDSSNGLQVTNTTTLYGDHRNTISVTLQNGVTLHNVTQNTTETGTVTIKGGDSFYLSAPCTEYLGEWSSGDVAGSISNTWRSLVIGGSDTVQTEGGGSYYLDPNRFVFFSVKWVELGNLALYKTSEDGEVAGISFKVDGPDGYSQTVTTDADGKIYIEGLVPGDYKISEVPLDKYVQPESLTVTVNVGQTASVSFSNVLKKFNLTVKKTDSEKSVAQGDATLAGAVYGVYKDGILLDQYTTDAKGEFTTNTYICGSGYTLKEIAPSEGYLIDNTEHAISGTPGTYAQEISYISIGVTEIVKKGRIAIIKHSDDGSTKIETPETGAAFQVYPKSSGSYDAAAAHERDYLVCDEYGHAVTKDLPYGVYMVHQVGGWDDTDFISDFDVFVAKDGSVYRYLINNAPYSSYVKIIKIDAETGQPVTASSAGYQIYDSNGENVTMQYTYPTVTTVDTFYTDTDGYLITPERLPYGDYTMIEVQAPYGYTINDEPISFTISRENASVDTDSGIEVITVKQDNLAQKGTVIVTKVGDTFASVQGSDEGLYIPVYQPRTLEGVVYEVIAAEDIYTGDGTLRASAGDVVDTITTGLDGTATSNCLYLGAYTVQEVSTIDGYVLNDTAYSVELTCGGQEVQVVASYMTMNNELVDLQLQLYKTMEVSEIFGLGINGEVSNVQFGMYAAENIVAADGTMIPVDGLVSVMQVSSDGTISETLHLPYGNYYVQEFATDKHYTVSDTKYEVKFAYADQNTAVVTITLNDGAEIENNLLYGRVKGQKVDQDGEPLQGAILGLFPADVEEFIEDIAYMTLESDEAGAFAFENVPYGEYVIREIAPPEGYLLSENVYPVNIQEMDAVIEIIVMNKIITGRVEGMKVDGSDEALEGALIGLFPADVEEFTFETAFVSMISGKNGAFSFEDVPYGKYVVREIAAPDGYTLNDTKYPLAIGEDGQIVQLEIVNEKVPETPAAPATTTTTSAPKTGDDAKIPWVALILSGIGLLIVCGVGVYKLKRKKGRSK